MKNKLAAELSGGPNRSPLRSPPRNERNERSYLREEDIFLYNKPKDLIYYSAKPKPSNGSPSSNELSMNRTELKKKSDDLVVTHVLQNEGNDVISCRGMSPEVGAKARKNYTGEEKGITGRGKEPVFGRNDSLGSKFRQGYIPPRGNHYEGEYHPHLSGKMDGTSYDREKRMALRMHYQMGDPPMGDPLQSLHQSRGEKIPNEGASILPSRLIKTEWAANPIGGRKNTHQEETPHDAIITKEVHRSSNYSFIDQSDAPERSHMSEVERKKNGTQGSSGSSTTRHRGHLSNLPHFGTLSDEEVEDAEDAADFSTASVMGSNDPKKSTQLRSCLNEGALRRANDSTNEDDAQGEVHKFNNTEQSLSDLIRAFQLKRAQNLGAPSGSTPEDSNTENGSAAPKKETPTRLDNCNNANKVRVAEKWVKRYEAPPQGIAQKGEELGEMKKGATLKMSHNKLVVSPSKWVPKDPFNKPKRSMSDDKTSPLCNRSGLADPMDTYGSTHQGESKLGHPENRGKDQMGYYPPRETNRIEFDEEGGDEYHLLNHQNGESTNGSCFVQGEGGPYEKVQFIPANCIIINGEEYHPFVEVLKNEQLIDSQENLTYPLMSQFMQPFVGSKGGVGNEDSNCGSFVERESCTDEDFLHQKDKLSRSINYIRQIKKANEQARYADSMEEKGKKNRQGEERARGEDEPYFVSPRFGTLSQEEVEEESQSNHVREAPSWGEKKNKRVNPLLLAKRHLREGLLNNARKQGNPKNGRSGNPNWALKNGRGALPQKTGKPVETPPKDRRVELVQNGDLARVHLNGEKVDTSNRPNGPNRPNRLNRLNLSDSPNSTELKRTGGICKSGANGRANAKKEDSPMKRDHVKDEKCAKKQTNTTLRRCPKIGSKKNDTNKPIKIKSHFISKQNNIPMYAVSMRNEPLKSVKMAKEERPQRHHNGRQQYGSQQCGSQQCGSQQCGSQQYGSQQYGSLNRTGKIICERKKMKSKDKSILFQKGDSKKDTHQDTPVEASEKDDKNKIYNIPSCHSSSSFDHRPIHSLDSSNLSCDSQETQQVSTLASVRKQNFAKMKEMVSREREAVRRSAIVPYPKNGARGGKDKWENKREGKGEAKGEPKRDPPKEATPKRNALCRTKNVAPIETPICGRHEIGKGTKGIMGGNLTHNSVGTQLVEAHKAEDHNKSARKPILAKKNKREKYPLDIEASYKCKSIYIKINVDTNNEELLKHTQQKLPKRSLEFKLFTTKFVNGFIKSTESKIYNSSSIILQNAETDVFYNITIHVYSSVVSSLWLYGSASFYLTKFNVERFKLKMPSSVTFNKEGDISSGERSAPKGVPSSVLAGERNGESKGASQRGEPKIDSQNTPEKGKHGEPLFFTNAEGQNTQDYLLDEEVKDISLDGHSSSSFDDDLSSDESDVGMEHVNIGTNLGGSPNLALQRSGGHSDHDGDEQATPQRDDRAIPQRDDPSQRNNCTHNEGAVGSSTYDELILNFHELNKSKMKNEFQNVRCGKGDSPTSAVAEKDTSNGEEEDTLQHYHRVSSREQPSGGEVPPAEQPTASYPPATVKEENHRVEKPPHFDSYLDENSEGNLKFTKFLIEKGTHKIIPDSTKLVSSASLVKEDTSCCSFVLSSARSFKDSHESGSGSEEPQKGKRPPGGGPPLKRDNNNLKTNFFRSCASDAVTNILAEEKKSPEVEERLPMLGAHKEKLAQIGRVLSEKWAEDNNSNCMNIAHEVGGIPNESNPHTIKRHHLGGLTRVHLPPSGKETKGDHSRRHLHNSFVQIPSMEKWKKENGLRNDSHPLSGDPQPAEKEPNSASSLVFSRGTFVHKHEDANADGLEAAQGRDAQNEVSLLSEIRNVEKSTDEDSPHSSDLSASGHVQVKAKQCTSVSNEHGPLSRDTPSHDKGEELSKGNFRADKAPTFRDEAAKWGQPNRSDVKEATDSNCNRWILHKNGNVANKASAPNGVSAQSGIPNGKAVHKFGPWMNRGCYPPQGKYTLPGVSPYKAHQGRSVAMCNPVINPMLNPVINPVSNPVINPMCSATPDKLTKLQSKNVPVQFRTRAEEEKVKYAQRPYFNKTNGMVKLPNGGYLLQGNNTVGHTLGGDFANKFAQIGEERSPIGVRSGIPSGVRSGIPSGLRRGTPSSFRSGITNGVETKMHNSEDLLYRSDNYKSARCAYGAVDVPPLYTTGKTAFSKDPYVDLPHYALRQNYNGANCPSAPTQVVANQNAEMYAKESAPKIPSCEESTIKDTPHDGVNLPLRKSNPEEDGLPIVGVLSHKGEPQTGANNYPPSGDNNPHKDLNQAGDNSSYKKEPTPTFQTYLNGETADSLQGGFLPGQPGGPRSGKQNVNPVSSGQQHINPVSSGQQHINPVSSGQQHINPISSVQRNINPISSGHHNVNPLNGSLPNGSHPPTSKLPASMQGITDRHLRQNGSPNSGPALYNPIVGANMPRVNNNIKMFAFNEEGIEAHLENQKRNKNQGKNPLYPYMQQNMRNYGAQMPNNFYNFKNGCYQPSGSPPDDAKIRAACLNQHAMNQNKNVLKKGSEQYFGRAVPKPAMCTYAPYGDKPYAPHNATLQNEHLKKCRFLYTEGLPSVATENPFSVFKTNQEKLSGPYSATASGNFNPVERAAHRADQNVQSRVGAYAPNGDARRVVVPGRAGQFPSPYVHWPQCAPQNVLHRSPHNANFNSSPINMHSEKENPSGISPPDGRSSPCSGYHPRGASLIKQSPPREEQKGQTGYPLRSLAKQPNQQGAKLTSSLASPNKVKGNTHLAVTFLDEPFIIKSDAHQGGEHQDGAHQDGAHKNGAFQGGPHKNGPFHDGAHPNKSPLESAPHMTRNHNPTSDEQLSSSTQANLPHQPNNCTEWEKSEGARKFDLKYNEINFKSIQCVEQTNGQFADHIYNMAKGCSTACSAREYTYTDNMCVKRENSFGKSRKFSPFFGLRNSGGNQSNTETEDLTESTQKKSPTAKSFQLSVQLGDREWGKIKFTREDTLDDKISEFIESNNLKKIFLSPFREKLKYMLQNDLPKWSMSITDLL
ncbi:hypothetical protein PVIIG_02249 [Plasmodium vivax India VII]|uniref:Uncharacterized protein n=1 Tax=Plasmodium vivax India VII TaxID=1077284 RepID=A0A0J9S5T7_PLAVI|nr:hypothetical protein PVIIG_02249 [Plasmodium vivax India VII]